MTHRSPTPEKDAPLAFLGGTIGTLAPFAVFLAGVGWLGLSGAPDERGFWPPLVAALAVGLTLARDRRRYAETVLTGMSHPMVMLMIAAWLFAGVLSTLLGAAGFVEALVWASQQLGLSGRGFVMAAFLVCAAISTSTGTSFGTIIIGGPLLFPAGLAVGAAPVVLAGAILGGATFGDSLSPISDTTIASAGTQGADIGGVVRSRLKYAVPAALLALLAIAILGDVKMAPGDLGPMAMGGHPRSLPMVAAPVLVIALLLRRRPLVEALLWGIVAAAGLGVGLGLIAPSALLRVEPGSLTARSLVIDGLERGVGVSVFTLLLMALVACLEASPLIRGLAHAGRGRVRGTRAAEAWIVGAVSAVALLTTHSVVAILTVGDLARDVGERAGLSAYRRANLLDLTVCTGPFLVPYCLPAILTANATRAAAGAAGIVPVSPLAIGLANAYSWALVFVVAFAIVTGYGRGERAPEETA